MSQPSESTPLVSKSSSSLSYSSSSSSPSSPGCLTSTISFLSHVFCCSPRLLPIDEIPLSSVARSRYAALHERSLIPFDSNKLSHCQQLHFLGKICFHDTFVNEIPLAIATQLASKSSVSLPSSSPPSSSSSSSSASRVSTSDVYRPSEGSPPLVLSLKSRLWLTLGFQGSDPSTDFRGAGLMSLHNLIYVVQHHPDLTSRLTAADSAEGGNDNNNSVVDLERYLPFAITGIAITFALTQLFSLQLHSSSQVDGEQQKLISHFSTLLEDDPFAFEHIYCHSFQWLEKYWKRENCNYMEFNIAIDETKKKIVETLSRKPMNMKEFNMWMDS